MSYTLNYDLYIRDDEMDKVKELCKKKKEAYVNKIHGFRDIIQKMLNDGVEKGEFHDRMDAFKKTVEDLEKDVDEIDEEIAKQIKNFLSDFEKADGDLY